MAKFNLKNTLSLHFLVFAIYIIFSLLIGEVQPFTKVTMYDSFPNWAYVFYLKNEKNETLFFRNNFGGAIHAGAFGHLFYSYCNQHKYTYGFGEEDEKNLMKVGDYMAKSVQEAWPNNKPKPSKILVVRKYLYYNNLHEFDEEDKVIGHVIF